MEQRPDWYWLNPESRVFLQRGYLDEGQTAEERVKEIAQHAEKILGIEGFGDRLEYCIKRGHMSLSSPVWANFGKKRGLPISCFGSYIDDSIESIMDTSAEIGVMSKNGGGTSAYFGAIRPRGSKITNNGHTDGSFNFLKIYEAVINSVSQGTTRKGMMAAYIDVEHADIDQWLDIHTEGNEIQLLYWGVCISNKWMNEMLEGDQYKREVWKKILKRRSEVGIPYITFTDTINENKPQVYKDKNLNIYASNLCFTGDTMVAVADGRNAVSIKELAEEYEKTGQKFPVYSARQLDNQKVEDLNHSAWETEVKEAIAFKTGSKKVIQLTLSDGSIVKCTEDHLLAKINGDWVEAKDSIGMKLESIHIEAPRMSSPLNIVSNAKILSVVSIEKLGVEDVYDLTVDDNHNFYVLSNIDKHNNASGILVHNCNEIALPSSVTESFVCCLSSMNIATYDEWKNTDSVKVATYFLDAVMTEFIEKASTIKHMERAVRFAKRHRALGLGVLGYHSYLQSKMIPFDSFQASLINNQVHKFIREEAEEASVELAELFGEPDLLKGYGRRNTTLMAIAPTKSSSFILGSVSPSIEPLHSNVYIKDLAKIKTIFKNPELEKLLKAKGKDNDEVWSSIESNNGSVQHLDFLTQEEKDVFKTFSEISQLTIVQQAAQRQRYTDQSQSLNLMIHPDTPAKDIHALHIEAWKLGVKGLYYQKSFNAAQEYNRNLMTCSSCEA